MHIHYSVSPEAGRSSLEAAKKITRFLLSLEELNLGVLDLTSSRTLSLSRGLRQERASGGLYMRPTAILDQGRRWHRAKQDAIVLADATRVGTPDTPYLRAAPLRRERLLLLSGEGRVDEHGVCICCRNGTRHLGGLAAAKEELGVHAAQGYHLQRCTKAVVHKVSAANRLGRTCFTKPW